MYIDIYNVEIQFERISSQHISDNNDADIVVKMRNNSIDKQHSQWLQVQNKRYPNSKSNN